MLNWANIDAVIFDMDGTLVDSMFYWRKLPENWFQQHGLATPDDLDQLLATSDLWQAAEVFSQKFAPDEPTEQIFSLLQQQMDKHYANDIPLLPGVRNLLLALRQAGKKMCIATMTDRPQVETMLHAHQLENIFDFLLTTPEVGAGKNQPDIFRQACRLFAAPPNRVAVFEDSQTAAKTVLRLGMPLVFLPTTGFDSAELQALASEYHASLTLLPSYADLPLPPIN